MAQDTKFVFIPQNKMNSEVAKDKELHTLLVMQRDKYLVHLSNKFINMPVEKIITEDKKYFMSIDKSAKLYYLVCYYNNIPTGICKFIEFSHKIFDIDFFQNILPKNKASDDERFLYVFGIYINEKYRGKGICKKMLDKITSCSKKNNIRMLISDIKQNNSSSIKCFTSTGFTKSNIMSRSPDVYFYTFNV